MRVKIVADSSANMYSLEGMAFEAAPLRIVTDEKEYVDNENLNVLDMVEEMGTYKGRSGSACPGVGDYLAAFEGYDEIYVVTIASTLSGSYNAAMTAKQQYEEENPEAKVFVLDAWSTGPGMKLHVDKMKELVLAGKDFDTICKELTEYRDNTSILFCLESLHNLANNGRVSHAVAKLAGLIGIRMIGGISEEGQITATDKCRGEKKTLDGNLKGMRQRGYVGGRVNIDHCFNEKSAEALKNLILSEYPQADVRIGVTGGLCSFYAEKGGLIVGFEVQK